MIVDRRHIIIIKKKQFFILIFFVVDRVREKIVEQKVIVGNLRDHLDR